MPRKYRPPAARRRKNRRSIPYEADVTGTEDTSIAVDTDISAPAVAVDVAEVPPEPEDRPPLRQASTAGGRHVSRDYSYVRGDVLHIVGIGAVIVIAMVITSFFR